MKITAVTAYAVKTSTIYQPSGRTRTTPSLPGTDYLRFAPYPQLYSRRTEVVIVKVETDDGLVGWGECNAPVGPEVPQQVLARILAPLVLGRDPRDHAVLFSEMLGAMRVRGHTGGHQVDAIAGLDTAIMDVVARSADRPLAAYLGGRFRDVLPAYTSGLRRPTAQERLAEAEEIVQTGMGLKVFLGHDSRADAEEIEALREGLGPQARLYADALWRCTGPEAVRLGRALERADLEFFEAPLMPEDVPGHAALAASLDVAVAVGEVLRTRYQFLPWFEARALDVAQPDLMRNGVTETLRIATVAEAFNIPTALHVGASTVIGMSATWQVASAIPNFLVQEHQPVMFAATNRWLEHPLEVRDGLLVVPDRPGTGVRVIEEELTRDVASAVRVTGDGAQFL